MGAEGGGDDHPCADKEKTKRDHYRREGRRRRE